MRGAEAAAMRLLAGIAVLLFAFDASALEQKQHRVISRASCEDAGLPEEFCERVGVEAYDTDAYEWWDLAAHAQIDDGQTACEAAGLVLDRERTLGSDIHDTLADLAWTSSPDDATYLAVQLGRALHTVQDNCAHHGQPNPQHAWASLSDSCDGTAESPDIQPAAIQCAIDDTAQVIDAFVSAVVDAGVSNDQLGDVDDGWTHWPARGDVCGFLATANQWDGRDGRWNNGVMEPMVVGQLQLAMLYGDLAIGDACAAGPSELALAQLAAPVDTSAGLSRCLKIEVYCLGKADEGAQEPPPWSDGTTDDVVAAGCSVGGGAGALPIALAFMILRARRRGGGTGPRRTT